MNNHFLLGVLGQLSIFAWMLLIGAIVTAVWKLKSGRPRALAIAIVLIVFAAFPGRWAWETQEQVARYETASAMFQERCKKSGEFIYRTEENVEGIFLLKVRPKGINFGSQYAMDDPYGDDSTGEDYLKSFFLEPMLQANKYASKENLEKIRRDYRGYRYVDAVDPKDDKRYRYTGSMKVVGKQDPTANNVKLELNKDPNYDLNIYAFVLDKAPAPDPAPRYGVTYDDISTRQERDYWIAGSSLKVIDLKTNEVMAERIGYMMDRGQGNNSGGRSPWLMAADHACPSFKSSGDSIPAIVYQQRQTQKFVTKVLNPIQEKLPDATEARRSPTIGKAPIT